MAPVDNLSIKKIELLALIHFDTPFQLMSREEQISRLQGNVRELQDESAKKEATLQKMEMDLINVEELKHKTDDNVRLCSKVVMLDSFEPGTSGKHVPEINTLLYIVKLGYAGYTYFSYFCYKTWIVGTR